MTTNVTPDIFVVDDQHPEDQAMLQALYSRSPASVVSHLDKLKQVGSGTFMQNYYVGYGHASIGDCGTTSIFIEQVSMLVAKAFQDTPLYSGQEASTRYLDFAQQSLYDPYDKPESRAILDKWMSLYNSTRPQLVEGLKRQHPFNPAEYKNEKVWENTLNARAFDIARALLPIGTTTLLSWTTNLRQARDHLRKLKSHPLPEVRATAGAVFAKLLEKYPNSFKATDMDGPDSGDTRAAYQAKFADSTHFASADELYERYEISDDEKELLQNDGMVVLQDAIDLEGLTRNESEVLNTRPSGAALPWRLEAYGRYNVLSLLDFGSYRDLQRHRNGVCQVPLMDARFGMHPWYMGEMEALLSADAYAAVLREIAAQVEAVKALPYGTAMLNQYLYPMGMQALVHMAYSVPQMVYVGELRSGKTVHASLRPLAQKLLQVLEADLPGIALYGDMDEDSWTAKRGEQTISAKAG